MILLLIVAATAACHPVEGESVLGRDLAAADSRFAAIPAEASLGYAPAPGARRVFHSGELSRLAARYGISAESFEDTCFDRPLRPIDRQRLLKALQGAELVESSLYPVPAGELVFPRSGLGPTQNDVAHWEGYVRYGRDRRFPIWARVRIHQDVVRGERVKVEVHSGAARLEFDGRAESGGSGGEKVSVLNLSSGKRFDAQVSGKGRVTVTQ